MTTFYSNALGTDDDGYAGYSMRCLLPVTGIAGEGQIRVTFKAGSTGLVVDNASVALLGAAAFPDVTTDPPVPLLFSGAAGFDIGNNATKVSDWVTFAISTIQQLAVIMDINSGGTQSQQTGAETLGRLRQKAAYASYNLATPASHADRGALSNILLVETQAVPAAAAKGGTATMMGI